MRLDHIPQSVQTPCNWTAVGAAVSSFAGWIQGPLAVVASILSIIWLAVQLYSWWKKQ